MKKLIVCALLVVFASTPVFSQIQSKPITEITDKELSDVFLVDVRTPEEFQAGHLPEANNINWYDANFAEQFSAIDKDKTIYLYCKIGGRSAQATERLKALGYSHVINLEGGYDAWIKKN